MSNGAECCALEICCPDAAVRKQKLTQSIADFTGADPAYCGRFLDWMDSNNLMFAPKEFQATLQTIITITRAHP